MTLLIGRPVGDLVSRPRPDTTPMVSEWSRPKGLPMARAVCPTRRSADLTGVHQEERQ